MGNPKDTYVIVTVDTCSIEKGNEDQTVTFSDNRGDMPGAGMAFKSKVDQGKKIFWVGNVKEHGQNCEQKGEEFYMKNSVEVKQIEIKYEPGNRHILKKDYYTDTNNDGIVVGKVKNVEVQGVEKYNITILVNGTDWYTIDPQMEMV